MNYRPPTPLGDVLYRDRPGSPCVIQSRDAFAALAVDVFCATHGLALTRLSLGQALRLESDADALAPILRHLDENMPGRAPVTIAEAESWGWWDARADAEACA